MARETICKPISRIGRPTSVCKVVNGFGMRLSEALLDSQAMPQQTSEMADKQLVTLIALAIAKT